MPIEHSDALVLKTVDFSETSLIVTLFTRDFGKIQGIAKGARRQKNSFESALDILTQICVSFIRKNSNALDILTEAKLVHRFGIADSGLPGLYAGYYITELLLKLTEDYEPMPTLFDWATATLNRLEVTEAVPQAVIIFEANLLRCLGVFPSNRMCVECQESLPIEGWAEANRRLSFGLNEGGVICPDCRNNGHFQQVASVSASAMVLLERIGSKQTVTVPPSDYFRTLSEQTAGFPPSAWRELRGLMNYLVAAQMGYRPEMQRYLDQMS